MPCTQHVQHQLTPPLHPSTLPHPSPLPLDVGLQVLVRVSRHRTQPVELEGLRLCAPMGHGLHHLQGRGGDPGGTTDNNTNKLREFQPGQGA